MQVCSQILSDRTGNNALKREVDRKSELVKGLNENIVNLSKSKHKLKRKYKTVKDELLKVQNQIKSGTLFTFNNSDLNSETLAQIEQKLRGCKEKIDGHEGDKIKEMENNNESLQADIDTLKQKLSSLEAELETERQVNEELRSKLEPQPQSQRELQSLSRSGEHDHDLHTIPYEEPSFDIPQMRSGEYQPEDVLEQIIDEVRCYEDVDKRNFSEVVRLTQKAFGQSIRFEEVNSILSNIKQLLQVEENHMITAQLQLIIKEKQKQTDTISTCSSLIHSEPDALTKELAILIDRQEEIREKLDLITNLISPSSP